MPKTPALQQLTIFQLKEGKDINTILPDYKNLNHQNFLVGDQKYDLYSKKPNAKMPRWVNFLPYDINLSLIGKASSPGAVLLTEIDERKYALTFGTGRHYLDENCWEERFGLRIVLNSVSRVRSIDKNSFDRINGRSRIQASKEFSIDLFGVDVEKDLLKAVTGVPEDKDLGSRMSGVDYLSVLAPIEITDLPDFIRKLNSQSKLDTYKRRGYAFIDQIRPVSDRTLIESLCERLIACLNAGPPDRDRVEMILPDLLDFSDFEAVSYKQSRSNPEDLPDISIDSFLTAAKDKNWEISLDTLRSRYVYSIHAQEEVRKVGTIYRCLLAEIDHEGRNYVLSGGSWYDIDSSYLQKIESFLQGIRKYPYVFPVFKHKNGEGEYNEFIHNTKTGFFSLDKDLIHPERSQKIEFCDLYTEAQGAKDLIHVKIGKSSATLSHLFSQGTVCAESFLEFTEIREQVRVKLNKHGIPFPNPSARINPQDYRIVFAIIRKRGSRLPFFARVNLRQAFRMLEKWNYQPALAQIDIDPAWLITKNVTQKSRLKKM